MTKLLTKQALGTDRIAKISYALGQMTAKTIQCQNSLVFDDLEALGIYLAELSTLRDQIYELLKPEKHHEGRNNT